jgi:hypothetical protein
MNRQAVPIVMIRKGFELHEMTESLYLRRLGWGGLNIVE